MEKITVKVEQAGGNLSAYIDTLAGCTTTGRTLEEIERNMQEAVRGHLEVCREFGDEIPNEFKGDYKLVFQCDTATLLNYYSNVFTKAALSRITGINERQLWHYAAGVSNPRPKQRKRIEEGLHKLGQELISLAL